MSNISLNVEVLAGTSIESIVKEAKQLAKKLNISYVCFDFNGVNVSIGPNADVEEAVEKFEEVLKKDNEHLVMF